MNRERRSPCILQINWSSIIILKSWISSGESTEKSKELPILLFEHIAALNEYIIFFYPSIFETFFILLEFWMWFWPLESPLQWHQHVRAEIYENCQEGVPVWIIPEICPVVINICEYIFYYWNVTFGLFLIEFEFFD